MRAIYFSLLLLDSYTIGTSPVDAYTCNQLFVKLRLLLEVFGGKNWIELKKCSGNLCRKIDMKFVRSIFPIRLLGQFSPPHQPSSFIKTEAQRAIIPCNACTCPKGPFDYCRPEKYGKWRNYSCLVPEVRRDACQP